MPEGTILFLLIGFAAGVAVTVYVPKFYNWVVSWAKKG